MLVGFSRFLWGLIMNQRWWITRTSQAEFTGWRMGNTHFFWANSRHLSRFMTTYGYGSIPIDTFLVGWTSIYQLFWCSPGVQGFDTLPYVKIRQSWSVMSHKDTRSIKQEYHGIDHQQHDFWCCLEVGYIYIYPKKLIFFIGNMMIMELLGVLCSDKAILPAEQLQ